jgi:signal peptidase
MAWVRQVLGWMATAVSLVLVLVIAGTIVLAIAQRRSPLAVPVVFHRQFLTLLSGSMTPTLRTGDLVVDQPVEGAQAEHLRIGDIVTYQLPGRLYDGRPMLITHRIVGIITVTNKTTGQQGRLYVTKGDANNATDPQPVAPSQIVGLYRWRIPYAGYVTVFVHRPLGFGLLVVLPILYLVGGEFWRLWRAIDEAERREREQQAVAEPTRTPLS